MYSKSGAKYGETHALQYLLQCFIQRKVSINNPLLKGWFSSRDMKGILRSHWKWCVNRLQWKVEMLWQNLRNSEESILPFELNLVKMCIDKSLNITMPKYSGFWALELWVLYIWCTFQFFYNVHILHVFVVVQLLGHVRLCNPMECSTPGFPVLHSLLELAQTHIHWVSDTIHPSHSLSSYMYRRKIALSRVWLLRSPEL